MRQKPSSLPEHSTAQGQRQSAGIADGRAFAGTREQAGPPRPAGAFTCFPTALFRHYAQLRISEGELVFLQQLWTYWWDERLPFPALGTIAAHMGKTVRQIQQYVRSLSTQGLLLVVPRADAAGRQLSNAYDLRPLLRALDTLNVSGAPEAAPRRSDPAGPRDPASPGMQDPTPSQETDPDRPISDLDLGSTPYPLASTPDGVDTGQDQPHTPESGLDEALARIASHLGDQAPRSSISRAHTLFARSQLSAPDFLRLVGDAAQIAEARLPAVTCTGDEGRPNAMPYFFATLERLLRPTPSRPRTRAPRAAPAADPSPAVPAVLETTDGVEHPLWHAVLAQVRGTMAPGAVARLAGAVVCEDGPDRLVLGLESRALQGWCEHMARARVVEALADLGHAGVELVFTTVAQDGCTRLASTA